MTRGLGALALVAFVAFGCADDAGEGGGTGGEGGGGSGGGAGGSGQDSGVAGGGGGDQDAAAGSGGAADPDTGTGGIGGSSNDDAGVSTDGAVVTPDGSAIDVDGGGPNLDGSVQQPDQGVGPGCGEEGPCGPGEICDGIQCVPAVNQCIGDEDCDPGALCIEGTCFAEECVEDDECAPGTQCFLGFCAPVGDECIADGDCPEGQQCSMGFCEGDVGPPPGADACLAPGAINAPGRFNGSTLNGSANYQACDADESGREVVYALAAGLGQLCIDTLGSAFDTVLYARAACNGAADIICNDDFEGETSSRIEVNVGGAPVFLFVDSYFDGGDYDFVLNVTAGACPARMGVPCAEDADCGEFGFCDDGICVDFKG